MCVTYLVGMLLAWYNAPVILLVFLILSGCFLLYLLMYRMHPRGIITRKDGFLWCLPVLLLLGFFAMGDRVKPPDMDIDFEEKAACTVSGEITRVVEKEQGKVLYVTDNVVSLKSGGEYPVENIIIHSSDSNPYLTGNKIIATGTIYKFLKAANPGQFNEKLYYDIQNIDYKLKAEEVVITDSSYSRFHSVLDKVKGKFQHVFESILSGKEAGTLIAMILGDKYLLEEDIRLLYQENGISHILAISGLHITLIGISIYKLLKKLKTGLIPAVLLSICLLYCYGILTGFSVSTNRAVIMFIVMLSAVILGRTYDMLSALSLCALLILLQNPLQIFSAGFLLSFGAVFGIAVLLPCLRQIFGTKLKVADGVFVCISAQMMTLPMILVFFYQFPIYSIFINLLILPSMSALILTSLAAGIAGIFSLRLGVFMIGGANYILLFIEWLCRLGSALPGNLYTAGKPDRIRILLYFILIAVFVWGAARYHKKRICLVLVLAILVLVLPVRRSGLTVTLLDAGQGEAIFMETGEGTTFLVDGGSADIKNVGTYRLQPFLLSQGVDVIDYAVVTHPDNDHISGLVDLFVGNKIRINHLVLPDILSPDINKEGDKEALKDPYMELISLTEEKDTSVLFIKAGDVIREGKLIITCLLPIKGLTYTSTNSYSTVLGVTYGEFDMLLTGDISRDGEDFLVEQFLASSGGNTLELDYMVTDYDVLKVAHHGSKNSTSEEFLAVVKPEYALISCSKDNYYGHPHEELLNRLKQIGSDIKVTYRSGAITIKTDGKKMEIREYIIGGMPLTNDIAIKNNALYAEKPK